MKNPFRVIRDLTRPLRRRTKPEIRAQAPSPISTTVAVPMPTAEPRFDNSCCSPVLSIVIPTYGQEYYTLKCLSSLTEWRPKVTFEVIVIDDASRSDDSRRLAAIPGLRFFENDSNIGFLKTCNFARSYVRGEYIMLLNNDTIVLPGAIDNLLTLAHSNPDAGLIGCKLIYPDGRLQEAGGIIWQDGSGWNYGRMGDPEAPEFNYVKEIDYASGAAILVPVKVWDELGGFDERYAPAYCEDSDFAIRVRKSGRRVLYQPSAQIVHFEGVTHGVDISSGLKAYQRSNQHKLLERWRDQFLYSHSADSGDLFKARDRSQHKKTLLVIDHYVPEPDRDAGSNTIFQFCSCFVEMGYSVKFFPENLLHTAYAHGLQQLGVEVLYSPFTKSLSSYLETYGPIIDYVFVSRPHVARSVLDVVARLTSAIVVYYGHDLHFARLQMEAVVLGSEKAERSASSMLALERMIWRSVDHVVYPSKAEVDVVVAHERCSAGSVFPFLFSEFKDRVVKPPLKMVLFVAGFAHPPNVDAATWLVSEIWPLICRAVPDALLTLAGSHPDNRVLSLASPNVRVTGSVSQAELDQLYQNATVCIVPLRFGAGVKLKVVEALSRGVPLATTSVGAQGIDNIETVAFVADDPSKLAMRTIQTLLETEPNWVNLANQQVRFARERFTKERMQAQLRQSIVAAENKRRSERESHAGLSTVDTEIPRRQES